MAAGAVGGANAINSGISQGINTLGSYNMMNQMMNNNKSIYGMGYNPTASFGYNDSMAMPSPFTGLTS